MPSGEDDPTVLLKRLAESAGRIRLGPGVVGKTSHVMLAVVVLWIVVVWRLSATEFWLDVALLAVASVGTCVALRWCRQMRDFATANPALALMEGADITDYQRFEAEAKGMIHRPDTGPIANPAKPGPMPIAPIGPDENE